MDLQLPIIACVAGAVGLLAYVGWMMVAGKEGAGKLRNRLVGKAGTDATRPDGGHGGHLASSALRRLGDVAAEPFMPKSREAQSELRRRLGYAGIYSPSAFKLVTGAKALSLGVGVIAGGASAAYTVDGLFMQTAITAVGGIIGYLAPMLWLKQRIKSNRKQLTHGLADALDLMVVCVEAGLTVDAAMQRVGGEMALAHPAIARELGITHMETRVGLSRMESLKNLGVRTGCEALQSLSAMLIQADRFGTSIAGALRIHAETLRQNRFHAAEELAAKASVKMSFPLVLFIFPATFIVLAGPTVIGLMNSPLFN
jgi:tight adherence protein C